MPTHSAQRRLLAALVLVAFTTLMAAPAMAMMPTTPGLPQAGWLAPLVRTLVGWLGMAAPPPGDAFDYLGCSPEPGGEPLCEPTD